MNKISLLAFTLLSLNLISSNAFAGDKSPWEYSGKKGPENWAQLTAENAACAGKNQSPINLTGFIEAELKPLESNYLQGGEQILSNGHTVQVNYQKGSFVTIDGKQFKLLQFHFHAPSENHINGKSYPLEVHLVHADSQGNLAVVAVMFEQGKTNSLLAKAWQDMPSHVGEQHQLTNLINVDELLPINRDYYRFNGSLTTPPCSEGVRWLVMKNAVTASKEQIAQFKHTLHEPNNRPIQALNSRVVLQ